MNSGPAVSVPPHSTAIPPMDAGLLDMAPGRWQDAAVALVALALEVPLLLAGASDRLAVGQLVIFHALVVAGLAGWVWLRTHRGADTGPAQLTLAATTAAGPFGAFGAIVAHVLAPRRTDARLLDAWYERIALSAEADPVTRLCEEVAIGRSIDLSAGAPRSFDRVVADGTLDERQVALGLIARQFHPEYVPALKAALCSPEPVVRVQAAAVAARVRGDLKRNVRETLAGLDGMTSPDEVLAAATRLSAAVRSGLLDETDRIRAEAAAQRLMRRAATTLRPASARGRALDALEAELISNGRFANLRVSRRTAAIGRGKLFRVRRIPHRQTFAPAGEAAA